MKSTRILVVDDSAFFRRVLIRSLESIEGAEVVGYARNGNEALVKLDRLEVDLIILDMKMPEMDGLQTLEKIKEMKIPVRVIILSGHSRKTVQNTVAALLLGAEDFLVKPTSSADNEAELRARLQKLVLLPAASGQERSDPSVPKVPPIPLGAGSSEVLVVASSTGGPNALNQIFAELPAVRQPILVAQHMPAEFTRSLANQLDGKGENRVKEAEHGEPLRPFTTYIAPGDFHLLVRGSRHGPTICLEQSERVNHCRPAADVLFRSAVEVFGRTVLGLVLTGMGTDGLEGSRAIVEAGGEVYSQDRDSCVVWGMPRMVTEAGLAQPVELSQLASFLLAKLGDPALCEGA